MKCPKCGKEMESAGSWSNSQVNWDFSKDYTLYQCPECKTVKVKDWSEN